MKTFTVTKHGGLCTSAMMPMEHGFSRVGIVPRAVIIFLCYRAEPCCPVNLWAHKMRG